MTSPEAPYVPKNPRELAEHALESAAALVSLTERYYNGH
jgi:hypothetical protein